MANLVEEVRRRLGEVLTEKIEQSESTKQAGAVKVTQKIKRSRRVKEALQEKQAAPRKLGRGITPPGNTGHSHGIGV